MGRRRFLTALMFVFTLSLLVFSQSDLSTVPRVVKYTGAAPAGTSSVTFAIYASQEGLAPLWLETQNVTLDETGHYTVLLGSTKSDGLPASIFASGDARWIGVKIGDAPESARTLLVSVPYALKAGDAETLGGKPLSAFVMAQSTTGTTTAKKGSESDRAQPEPGGAINNGSSNGVAGYISKFDSPASVVNSTMFETNVGVGIGTTTPNGNLAVESTSEYGIVVGQNSSANSRHLLFGYNTAQNYGAISSVEEGIAYRNLVLNLSGGNVGVGTNTPQAKLAVNGNVTASGTMGIGTTAPAAALGIETSGPYAGIAIGQNVGSNPKQLLFGYDTTNNFAAFSALQQGVGYTSLNLQPDGGKVGIGTKFPQAVLDVNGNVHTSGTIIFNDGSQQSAAGVSQVIPSEGLATSVISNHLSVGLQACTNGQVLQSTGTTWQCVTPTGSGGVTLPFAGAGTNTTAVFAITQHGAGVADPDPLTNVPPAALSGISDSTSNFTVGVFAKSTSPNGLGVLGVTTGGPTQENSAGVIGIATSATGKADGVNGQSSSPDGVGGDFSNLNTSGAALRAEVGNGQGNPVAEFDVTGNTVSMNAANINIQGTNGPGANITLGGTVTVQGGNLVVNALQTPNISNPQGPLLLNSNTNITGDLHVSGNISSGSLSKPGGTFKIDHPLDPTGKYLYHSFVESPDMMNIYNGVIMLDAKGQAWITMADWFEALNMDFRYQLTSIGHPAPNLYVAVEMSGNRFKIAGGPAHGKVSWQVTGIRHDAWADAHRYKVEEVKPLAEQGTHLYPGTYPESADNKALVSANHK